MKRRYRLHCLSDEKTGSEEESHSLTLTQKALGSEPRHLAQAGLPSAPHPHRPAMSAHRAGAPRHLGPRSGGILLEHPQPAQRVPGAPLPPRGLFRLPEWRPQWLQPRSTASGQLLDQGHPLSSVQFGTLAPQHSRPNCPLHGKPFFPALLLSDPGVPLAKALGKPKVSMEACEQHSLESMASTSVHLKSYYHRCLTGMKEAQRAQLVCPQPSRDETGPP